MEEHEHDEACLAHVAPNIYDGVLVWQCSDGELRNAWAGAFEQYPGDHAVQKRYLAANEIIDAIKGMGGKLPLDGGFSDGAVPAGS